jgi:hypothetical protein
MATSNSVIPTFTKLASGVNINYIGCVDNTLPAGSGLISANDNKKTFGNTKQHMNTYLRQVYGLQPTEQIGWSDCYMAANNIMVVNFRLFCCLASYDDATSAFSHSNCSLLSTKHRDSYGLIYRPTNTVIRLRDRPLFGKVLTNTPKILASHMSSDKRTLSLVVESSEAIRTPTKNHQIVVIDTLTGKYEIAFSASFSTGSVPSDGIPEVLCLDSSVVILLTGKYEIAFSASFSTCSVPSDGIPEVLCLDSSVVIFKIFGQVIQQPIFQARKDIMATKLYDMARGSIPLELMQHVTAYLA